MSTLFYGSKVGGVGSGKYAPCQKCGKSLEQPPGYPMAVKEYCGPKCQQKAQSDDSEWDATDEALALAEAKRFR